MLSSFSSSLSLLSLILGTVWIAALIITTTLMGTSTAFVVTVPSRSSYSSASTSYSASSASVSVSVSSSSLFAASQQNIDDAMAATEQYGIKSSEARLAWEVVEECDASTNDAAAYTPGDNEAPSPSTMSEEEMKDKMEQLMINCSIPKLLADQQLREDVMAELQSIKLMPSKQQPKPKIAGLLASKIKARAISKQYGNASSESKLAWEEVEELASSGLSNAIGSSLTAGEECDLEQAAEACMALEELDRFLTSGGSSKKQ